MTDPDENWIQSQTSPSCDSGFRVAYAGDRAVLEHPACICHLWIASEYGGREHPPQLGFQGRRSPADEQHSLDQRCIVSKAGLHELDNCLDKNSLLTRHFRAYIDRIGTRSAMKQKIKLARTGTAAISLQTPPVGISATSVLTTEAVRHSNSLRFVKNARRVAV